MHGDLSSRNVVVHDGNARLVDLATMRSMTDVRFLAEGFCICVLYLHLSHMLGVSQFFANQGKLSKVTL